MTCNDCDDRLSGVAAQRHHQCYSGHDWLDGVHGQYWLEGGVGDDLLITRLGNDCLGCVADIDTLSDAACEVAVRWPCSTSGPTMAKVGATEIDGVQDFENIIRSQVNDISTGNASTTTSYATLPKQTDPQAIVKDPNDNSMTLSLDRAPKIKPLLDRR